MEGDARCGPATARSATPDRRRRPPSATARTRSAIASPISPATSAACRRARSASTTTPRPTRARLPSRGARAGAGSTTSTSPGSNPDQGQAQSDLGRLLADHRARRLRHAASQLAGGRDVAALADRSYRTPGPTALQRLAARRSGQRRADDRARSSPAPRRCAAGGRLRCRPDRRRGRFPGLDRAAVSDAHSGAAGGQLQYRRIGTDAWTELPTRFQPAAGGDGRLVAALPERPRRRASMPSGPKLSTPRAIAPRRPPRRTGPRWFSANRRRPPCRRSRRRSPPALRHPPAAVPRPGSSPRSAGITGEGR